MASTALSNDYLDEALADADQRAAPRFTSLIRAAKLICGQGEFVCVVRDVSGAGVRVRCFHTVPSGDAMALQLQNGDIFEIHRVRGEGNEASFQFAIEVPKEKLVQEHSLFPRRPLRLNLAIPLSLRLASGQVPATTENLSQQGCRIEAAAPLALGQSAIIESQYLPGIRAKVRWRGDGSYGLVFDDTFTLSDFAVLAARLQCPALVG